MDLKPVERSTGLFAPKIPRWSAMNYVSNIAESILSHTRTSVVLGPELYTAIAEWEKREIPVAVVLISIDEVYRQASESFNERPPVEMLQDTVSKNFTTWLAYGGERKVMSV